MSNLLVVETCTWTGQASAPDDTTITVLPISVTLPKVKCSGNKVYNTISYTASMGTYTGTGVVTANSTKNKSTNLAMVLDNATSTCTLTNSVTPFDTKPCTVTLKTVVGVKQAGQTKVKAV